MGASTSSRHGREAARDAAPSESPTTERRPECVPRDLPAELITARRMMNGAASTDTLGPDSDDIHGVVVSGRSARVPVALQFNQWSKKKQFVNRADGRGTVYTYPTDRRAKYDVTLDEAFDSEVRGVFVSGEAGSGKTHLFTKIVPHLWSNGLLWQDRFDLVAVFDLDNPDVQRAASLTELLAVFLEDVAMASGEESAAYFSDGSATEKRLCLIFDGLSECELNDCSDFLRAVVERTQLCECLVIVLSRHLAECMPLDSQNHYNCLLEVTGFQPTEVHSYIRQRLSAVEAQALLAELESDLTTATLVTLPIVTVATCQAVLAGARQPSCLTSAMQCIVLLALNHSTTSANHACAAASDAAGDHVCFQSLADLPPSAVESLLPIGRFALENLMRRKFAFKLSELEAAGLGSAGTHLGLVVARKRISASRGQWHAFPSPSLQEFLAAWFAVSRLMHTRRQAVSLVEQIGPCPGRLNMFWRYVIALAPTKIADCVMSNIWRRMSAEDAYLTERKIGPHALELVSSAAPYLTAADWKQVTAAILATLLDDQKKLEELANTLLHHSGDITTVTTTGEKSGHQRVLHALGTSTAGTADSTAYIATVLALWLAEHTDGSSNGVQLYDALLQVSDDLAQACKLILLPKWMIDVDAEKLLGSRKQLGGVSREDVEGVVRMLEAYVDHYRIRALTPQGGDPEFVAVDPTVSNLGLYLRGMLLTRLHCCTLACVLRWHGDCRGILNLAECQVTNDGWALLAPALQQCTRLNGLDLRGCEVTDAKLLGDVLARLTSITFLTLNDCHLGDDGLATLVPALLKGTMLSTVRLEELALTGASLPLVTRLLKGWPYLRYFRLAGNSFLGVRSRERGRFIDAVKAAPCLTELGVTFEKADGDTVAQLQGVRDNPDYTLQALMAY